MYRRRASPMPQPRCWMSCGRASARRVATSAVSAAWSELMTSTPCCNAACAFVAARSEEQSPGWTLPQEQHATTATTGRWFCVSRPRGSLRRHTRTRILCSLHPRYLPNTPVHLRRIGLHAVLTKSSRWATPGYQLWERRRQLRRQTPTCGRMSIAGTARKAHATMFDQPAELRLCRYRHADSIWRRPNSPTRQAPLQHKHFSTWSLR